MAGASNAPNSLGIKTVTTHGTPVQLTTTETVCKKLSIQPIKALGGSGTSPTSNTGWVYLLNSSTAKGTTGTNVVAALDVDQNALTLQAPGDTWFDLSKFYLDSDTDGDGALVSYA